MLHSDFNPVSPRNWTEDFAYENGNYVNKCCICKNEFIGYKRRVVCKVCFAKTTPHILKKLLVFPTWILVKILLLFVSKSHPWKYEKVSLNNWAEQSTDANNLYSGYFWMFGITICCLIIIAIISYF